MEENRDKKLLWMQSLAAGLALVIFVIWMFNLKNVWRDSNKNTAGGNNAQWTNLKTELDKTLTDLKSQVSQVQQSNASNTQAINQLFLDNLLKKTKETASSSASVSTGVTATSTATSTGAITTPPAIGLPVVNSGCPKYINCMPTIGGSARACQIPAGCTGITQLVY